MSGERRGVLLGLAAYALWGLLPLYWSALEPARPLEILAHRLAWSFVFVVGVILVQRRFDRFLAALRDRTTVGRLAAAAVAIAVNWFVYIYGVDAGLVVETSLGYFMNPLVLVLLGVVVLRERVRPLQWAAVAIAAAAVTVLAVDSGRPPWIALTLAVSFGTYGLIKKTTAVAATDGFAIECGVLVLPAVGFLATLGVRGDATFGEAGAAHAVLLVGAGVVTAIPLLLFAAAARRVDLVSLGVMQYVAPVLQFALGVLVFHEVMAPARWAGFALVWLALIVFSADQVRHHTRRASTEPVAIAT